MEKVDIASIVGMLLGVVMFVFGVLSNGGVASLHSMWDTASFIITIGGSIAGTLASFKLADFINGIKSIKLIFKDEVQDPAVVINQIISLSNTARKEGLLALEEAANGIEDDFLKKGIMLVVDGTDPELVRGIMETDLACVEPIYAGRFRGFGSAWPYAVRSRIPADAGNRDGRTAGAYYFHKKGIHHIGTGCLRAGR